MKTKIINSLSIGLLVLGITVSILGTGMLSLQQPQQADAEVNCSDTGNICSGGGSYDSQSGGFGGHIVFSDDGSYTNSGGSGGNDGTNVGGRGTHGSCDASSCDFVGGSGLHTK